MSTSSNSEIQSKHKWLIPFLFVPLLVFAFMGLILILKERQPSWTEQGRQLSGTNAYTVWASAEYEPIRPGAPLQAIVSDIDIDPPGILSTEQHEALRLSVYNFLMAFHTGEYEYYRQFRRPVEKGLWNRGMHEFRRKTVLKVAPEFLPGREDAEVAVDRAWFLMLAETKGYTRDGAPIFRDEGPDNVVKSRVDSDSSTNGFLTTISRENCRIYVEVRTNMPPPLDLFVTRSENDGYFSANPAFVFEPKPNEVLKRDGSLLVATVKVLVGSKRDRPIPVFYRLYWIVDYVQWVPYEHCIPCANRTNYFIF